MQEKDIPMNGAIVHEPKPHEDYTVGMSSIPFDWEKGFQCGWIPKAKDQGVSSACGGYASATLKEIQDGFGIIKSPKFIYSQAHAESGGTSIYALGNLLVKKGVCAEYLCPSTPPTESNLTRTEDLTTQAINDALNDRSYSYAQVTTLKDIESVAQAIRDHNGCILGLYGKNNGTWRSEHVLPPLPTDTDKFAHWVAGIEAGMYQGKKAIRFMNSWGEETGNNGTQWITEDYFTSGNVWCAWTITENPIIPPFKYTFTKPITYGQSGDEVVALQKALTRLGFFKIPDGVAYGYYGKLTAYAVFNYQVNRQVAQLTELNALQGKVVGPATRNQLNKDLNGN
jgi:hypothetical protein